MAVVVMLQPFDYNPEEKNNHKFMVQSLFAPNGPIEQDQLVLSLTLLEFSFFFFSLMSHNNNVYGNTVAR